MTTTYLICAVAVLLMLFMAGLSTFLVFVVAQEQRTLNKEMFGLLKKIEGLTAQRREQILTQFDKLVESLTNRIPALVAAQASDKIFETESKILTRLAELEPSLSNEEHKDKLDDVIHSMEALEKTLIAHTATAVHQVMLESRRSIFDEDIENSNLLAQ